MTFLGESQRLVKNSLTKCPFKISRQKMISSGFQRDLTKSEKSTLSFIVNRGHRNKKVWYSVQSMADALELHPRTVRKAIRSLELQGFILRTERFRSNMSQTSNNIHILPMKEWRAPMARRVIKKTRHVGTLFDDPDQKVCYLNGLKKAAPESTVLDLSINTDDTEHSFESGSIGSGSRTLIPFTPKKAKTLAPRETGVGAPVSPSKAPNQTFQAMESYKEAYKLRYKGLAPLVGGKEWAIVKRMTEKAGLETMRQVFAQYVQHNERDFLKTSHDLVTCERYLQRLVTELHMGERVYNDKTKTLEKEQWLDQEVEIMLSEKANGMYRSPFHIDEIEGSGELWKLMNSQELIKN